MIGETIKRWIDSGQVLLTPGRGIPPTHQREFKIGTVGDVRITFDFPKSQVHVWYDEIEHAINETRKAGGRVRIGAYEGRAELGTFQRFLQDAQGKHKQQRNAEYVAAVLEECGISEYTIEGGAKGIRLI